MGKRFILTGHIAAFLGLIVMVNAHWAILQSIAWGGMLISYSARSGIEAGIKETFDGQHPCKMCCAIKKAKTREQSPEKLAATVVPVVLRAVAPAAIVLVCSPETGELTYPRGISSHDRMRDPPPIPPPRGIPA